MEPGAAFRVGKKVAGQFMRDDVLGLSAELSYRLLFAVFPFFIFVTALAAFITNALNVENPSGRIVSEVGDALPEDAGSVLEDQLTQVMETQAGGLLSFGVLVALFAAAGATNAAIKAMNRAYNVPESRPIYRRYPRALGITLVFAFSLLIAFAIIVGAQVFAGEITDFFGIGENLTFVLYLIQVPLALVFVILAVSFLYWAAPNIDVPFRWLTPGAFLFVVVWLVATYGFAFYVANFANYNATYGALAGVIILMFWFYITSLTLLVGAEFNAVIEEEADAASLEERRQAKREEAGEQPRQAAPPPSHPGRSPRHVAAERPLSAAFGAVAAGLVLLRVAGQR